MKESVVSNLNFVLMPPMKKKRLTTNKQRSNKLLKRFTWGVIALLALIGFIGVGYYLGYVEALQYAAPKTSATHKALTQKGVPKELAKQEVVREEVVQQEPATALEQEQKLPQTQTLPQENEDHLKEQLKSVLKEGENKYAQKGASHEYEGDGESLNKPIKEEFGEGLEGTQKVQDKVSKKPDANLKNLKEEPRTKKSEVSLKKAHAKLAIIIDDVSFESEVDAIKKLNLNLTMSFLPPNKIHPDSAFLASREPFYMVHLPMQAVNFAGNEPLTLKVDDSQAVISQRVDDIVKLFPRVKYINNHTGSKFTADEAAMHKLIVSLQSHNIEFIDSRTIGQTKVPKVMRSFGQKYRGRDVFLDHAMDLASVKKQIFQAVKIAKKRGYAIAIGHPHVNTLKALRQSKELLKSVELVQINRI